MEEVQNKFNQETIESLNVDGGVENVCSKDEFAE